MESRQLSNLDDANGIRLNIVVVEEGNLSGKVSQVVIINTDDRLARFLFGYLVSYFSFIILHI